MTARIDHAAEAMVLLDRALADNDRWLEQRRAIARQAVLRHQHRHQPAPAFEVVAELYV